MAATLAIVKRALVLVLAVVVGFAPLARMQAGCCHAGAPTAASAAASCCSEVSAAPSCCAGVDVDHGEPVAGEAKAGDCHCDHRPAIATPAPVGEGLLVVAAATVVDLPPTTPPALVHAARSAPRLAITGLAPPRSAAGSWLVFQRLLI